MNKSHKTNMFINAPSCYSQFFACIKDSCDLQKSVQQKLSEITCNWIKSDKNALYTNYFLCFK